MFHDIRPPLFGGAFGAALVCAIVLTALVLAEPAFIQWTVLR